ncbi:MFS transporter [Propionimicrobium lymphophilum]|uniref:MFS transporter n=1 Tax=Propionimicrobium lymphophilum TaxID=33012 RepID=UPI00254B62A3|nr:MFS transporter [Propionimicrobium lymphophilum]MDK7710594.1 MFS transporter [Propionimicrobium lymphophilum]MDK7733820.1 MFS transporter [Propionimicrobium lymphophilum]
MDFLRRLQHLMRRPLFRRIVILRLFSQGGDSMIQVGMASYVLFNPQSQASGPAIAAVLAITMLPFSVVGPFLSELLDRFSRQRITIVCDVSRIVLCVAMAVAVASSATAGVGQILLMVLLLFALSINRLQLAGLSAGLPFTIEKDEYVEAVSLMPMLGPIAAVAGGGAAAIARITVGNAWGANQADGFLFCLAAVCFAGAVWLALGIGRRELGPTQAKLGPGARSVLSGLVDAGKNLWQTRPAFWAIATVFFARMCWGALIVTVVLLYRHHFHDSTQEAAAMVDMAAWFGLAGFGFALCGVLVTPASRSFGIRKTVIGLLLASALTLVLPAAWLSPISLLFSGLLIGLLAQSIKACGDTIVQAHTTDRYRGRIMVIYDIFNNLGIVVGALIAGFTLPADGASTASFWAMICWFLVVAAIFTFVSAKSPETYDRGTTRSQSSRSL